AASLLVETFGPSQSPREASFSHGVVGLMSEHTHYFNGFAVLLTVDHGEAVAIRVAEESGSRCIIEGGDVFELSAGDPNPMRALIARLVESLRSPDAGVEIAVTGSVPGWWWEVSLSSVGVATARALQGLFSRSDDTVSLMRIVADAIGFAIDLPFSVAYPLAADDGRPFVPVLVDTETREHLILSGTESDDVAWGVLSAPHDLTDIHDRIHDRIAKAAEALDILRRHGFPDLTSYRELEHRDLERALAALPDAHAPVVRYLVTENRRVQKLVAAVRRSDWQMMGALMFMSHAVQRDDWKMTSPESDHVVAEVEAMSLEGLYGARATGRTGSVLIAGQPFVIPNFLDRVQSQVRDRFQVPTQSLLL
ncbi:MAG TPA: galactokinase, partial [Rhodothermales bacterium]